MQTIIATFSDAAAGFAELEAHEAPLYLTPNVVEEITETFLGATPEAGGKLFGPSDRLGVDRFEFDEAGSENATSTVYAPDVTWGEERVRFWLQQESPEQRFWYGDIHLHPGNWGWPSRASGPAKGDLGYAAAVLAANSAMDKFYIPIVTKEDAATLKLWSWVVTRADPTRAQYAPLEITAAENFPVVQSAPVRAAPRAVAPAVTIPFLTHEVAVLTGLHWRANGQRLSFVGHDITFLVELPHAFPAAPPRVVIATDAGDLPLRFRWRPFSERRPEVRLARLLRIAAYRLRRACLSDRQMNHEFGRSF